MCGLTPETHRKPCDFAVAYREDEAFSVGIEYRGNQAAPNFIPNYFNYALIFGIYIGFSDFQNGKYDVVFFLLF